MAISPQEAARRIRELPKRVAEAVLAEVPVAVVAAEADLKDRVFNRGNSAEQGSIGKYSTTPLYVSTNQSNQPYTKLRNKGKGKNGRGSKFANGKARHSRYFKGGYAEFRRFLGRDGGNVNLKITGSLERSISTGTRKNGATIAFTNEEQTTIGRAHEAKYAKRIFVLSNKEGDKVLRRLDKAASRAIEKYA